MNREHVIVIFTAFIISLVWMFVIVANENSYKHKAIENKCAQYNPQTAEFEWIKDK